LDDSDTQHINSLECHLPPSHPPNPHGTNHPIYISTTNEFSFKAYTFAATSPHQNLLHKVNATWHELSNDTYGDTYHTATPSIWFQQIFSLNLSLAIANHLRGTRNKLANPTPKRQTNDDINGKPYPFTVASP
jgi:hypothetical protein